MRFSFLGHGGIVLSLLLTGCSLEQAAAPYAVYDESAEASGVFEAFTCDSLKTKILKKACEQEVFLLAAQHLKWEVMSTFDLERCQELPTDFVADCQSIITLSGIRGPISVEEGELLKSAAYDSSVCASLSSDSGLRAYCESEVALAQEKNEARRILEEGTAKECNSLSIPALQDQCLRGFGIEPVSDTSL